MPQSFLGRSQFLVLTDLEHVCEECAKNFDIWGIPEGPLAKMSALVEKARLALNASTNRFTKSPKLTAAKNDAFDEMKAYASEFISLLKYNQKIPNSALVGMGLPTRDHIHFPKPPPSSPFNLKLKKDKTKVRAFGSRVIEGQPLETKVPEDATGGMRLEHYLKSKGIATVQHTETSKSRYDFNLPEETKGDTLVVRGQWIDDQYRGGPWSDWVEIFLS